MPGQSPSKFRRRRVPPVVVPIVLAGLLWSLAVVSPVAAAPAGAPASALLSESAARTAALRSGQRVEVTALTSETRRVYADADGRFTAVLSVLPERVHRQGRWVPVDPASFTADPPSWTGDRTAWTQVWSNTPTTSYYNGANLGSSEKVARVGYDATDGKQTRSFFRFDTSGVKGKRIVKASLQTYETWSRSCTGRQVEAWETGGISSGTTWGAQPAWISRLDYKSLAKGYSSSCPAGGVEFNVTAHVTKAATNGWDAVTQGLRASTTAESNKDSLSWKKFRNNPSLTIVYNSTPDTPGNLTTEGSPVCGTGSGRLPIGTPAPTLRATVSDPDNAVMARFEWWAVDGTAPLGSHLSPSVAGGKPTTVAARVPAGVFDNGAIGRWRVRAEDGLDHSGWSPWCEFQVDTSRPPIPLVSSSAFPDDGPGTAVMGEAVTVVFAANGGTTVTAYEYTVNGDGSALGNTLRPSVPGGSASLSVLPDRYVNWIHVRSVSDAGNRSEVATAIFYAGPAAGPVADWGLDETGDATIAADSSANARDAILGGGASWGDGRYSGALRLDGVNGHAVTAGPVLDTTGSFSVSAWVRLTDGSHNGVAVSQAGTGNDAFALYYSVGYNRWVFNRNVADGNSTLVRAVSTSVPAAGHWTHLIGVYDADTDQIRLYVNGVLEASSGFGTPWRGGGGLQIGRGQSAGGFGNYWEGEIDAVQAYDRPLLAGEIQQVSRPEGRWALDETAGSGGTDAYGRHAVTWSGGVSRVAGVTGNGLGFSGGTASTSGPVLRTDSSYTVSAWLRPGAVGRNEVAVSQDGAQVSGFNLGFSRDPLSGGYRWSVRVPNTDSLSATVVTAVDLFAPPASGVWTHLAAVYDAKDRRLRLYVDGQIAGEAVLTSVVNAAGPLRLGSGRLPNTSAPDPWGGALDEVRAFSGVLTDQEIHGMYAEIADPVPAEVSFWPRDAIPAHEMIAETRPLELGLRFNTAKAGSIVGLRFLKGGGDTAASRPVTLWSGAGAVLVQGTTSGETASGWQEVRLADPVPVEPGETYVVSYHARANRFTAARGFFTGTPLVSGPLTAPGTANGVYAFGAAPAFPTTSNGSNYFADVIFS